MKIALRILFDKCRVLWGINNQILMLVEESTELAHAALQLLRVQGNGVEKLRHLAEEIADTEFMIEEIKYYYNLDRLVAKLRKEKQERLEKRVRL